jgi:hypothetical protein
MNLIDTFLKALFRDSPNPNFKEGCLSLDTVYALLEDPEYSNFSPKLKQFIQKQECLLEVREKLVQTNN